MFSITLFSLASGNFVIYRSRCVEFDSGSAVELFSSEELFYDMNDGLCVSVFHCPCSVLCCPRKRPLNSEDNRVGEALQVSVLLYVFY